MFRKMTIVAASALLVTPTMASAAPGDYGIDIYISAPTVQGTAVTTGLSTESFNLLSTGSCPSSIALGTIDGDCSVSSAGDYGGASANANDATPTTGGGGSNYANTSGPSNELTISLSEPATYLGFWWSAGTSSNEVELYSGDERVALMTTATLMTLLESASVSSIGGSSYPTDDYFGNPRNGGASGEPFLYLNLYGTGGATFDRVVLSGGGFEFDNIAVSDLSQSPANGEVPVQFVPGENAPDPDDEPLANTGAADFGLMAIGASIVLAGLMVRRRRAS